MSINLSSGTRSGLLVVQAGRAQVADMQARLASGLEVSRPTDDATAYFGASALRARAEGFDATLDGIGQAKAALEASLRGAEAGRRILQGARAQVARFARHLPDPDPGYATRAKLRDGLTAGTDLASLDDDPYTPGSLVNGRNVQIRVEDASGTLLRRAQFRYDAAGPIPADVPGATLPRYYARTVGDLVNDINASALGVTARLEDGRLSITANDPGETLRFLGSRDMLEALHMGRDRIRADRTEPSQTAPAILRGVTGVTRDTVISTLPGGVTNNRWLRFMMPSEDSPLGYTEATFRFRNDGRRDLGGRTVGDLVDFVNDVMPRLDARIEGGQLVVEGDARGLTVFGSPQMQTALGLPRGTTWGGAVDAPKRLVGAVAGLDRDTDANGNANWIRDGQGGQVRFRYGTAANRDGTTLGDFVDTINAAERRGEVALTAGFTEDGRVYLESTGGTDTLPMPPGSRPLRTAGLTYNRAWPVVAGAPYVLPTASDGLSEAAWSDFKAVRDTLEQYDALIADASYGGTSTLERETTSVTVNAQGDRLDVARGIDLRAAALDVADIEVWDLRTADGLEETLARIDAGLARIEAQTSRLTNDIASLDVREAFNRALADNHRGGADAWTAVDTDAAAAKLLAADTRGQMAFAALTLMAEADRGVLRMF